MIHRAPPPEGQGATVCSDGIVPAAIAVPVADLLAVPGGARQRQLLWGAGVTICNHRRGYALVKADADGYVGYIAYDTLGPPQKATHLVSARSSHVYSAPDFRSIELRVLSLGSRVVVTRRRGRFAELAGGGYLPLQHAAPAGRVESDPVAVAERLLGTPYLWGGNSCWGIDCSGLVQMAFRMAGISLPGDSALQRGAGRALADDASLRRGDLLFWCGHVAMVVDDARLIHANVNDMAVAYEPIGAAIARIGAGDDGPVIARRRLR